MTTLGAPVNRANRGGRPRINPLPEMAEPVYDRAPGESDVEFERFCAYLTMPPGERSLLRLAEMLGCSQISLKKHSSEWAWPYRCDRFMHDHAEEMVARWQSELATKQVALLERQVREGSAIEMALAEQVLRDVSAGLLDAKDALNGFVAMRKDNRAALMIPNAQAVTLSGTGPGGAIQLSTVEDLEAHQGRWMTDLQGDLDALELTAEQRARLAERWALRAQGQDPDVVVRGELAG